MAEEDKLPVVSGISPKEGSPGTKITIRGENLGEDKDDIIDLTVNGESCLKSLEYFSSKKLVFYSPDIVGKAQIIVTTVSGGEGTCLVHFTGLVPELEPALDPLEESNVWVDEVYNPLAPGMSTAITETPKYMQLSADPLGMPGGARQSKRKPSQANLEKLFPNSSGDLNSSDFNPKWFLAEKHRSTSFGELKTGLRRLREELTKREEAPVLFMRDNLSTFLQAYDTLSDVNELLIRNESESTGGSLTDKVEELLKDAATHAEKVFKGIIKNKTRADKTRNALNGLQRYKFLFNLPSSIEKSIKNGEYDLVTTDYEKAKQLFASTQGTKVFKKVMDEVENQIRSFRKTLRKELQTLPSTLEEQKKIIKFLLELDCEGDPAWECSTNMHQWLLKLLFTSKDNHQNPDAPQKGPGELSSLPPSLVIEQDIPPDLPPRKGTAVSEEEFGHSRTTSDVSFTSTVSQASVPPPVPPSPLRSHQRNPSSGGRAIETGGRPMKILFVEELTNIISDVLPDLWRLGKAYLSGSLLHGTMLSEKQQQLANNFTVNQPRFESMIQEIVEVYTDMVNCSLFSDAYDKLSQKKKDRLGDWTNFEDPLQNSGDWLPQIVRQIRECVDSLQGLSLPEKTVAITTQLAFNVRTLCADTLFHRAARDIQVLHEREDWRVHAEEGCIITSLPILFENLVVEVLITLKEIVVDSQSEVLDHLNHELLDNSRQHLHALLDHFVACLDHLAFHQESEHVESINMITEGQDTVRTSEEPEGAIPTNDEQLLMILSNLNYVMDQVIPRLFHCFVSHGYPPAENVRERVMEELLDLDEKIFSEYIIRKSQSVTGIIDEGMRAGFFDWDQCPKPTAVRNYIKEVLYNLVIIHAEVHAVSSRIVDRVLQQLVERLSNEFLKLIKEVDSFSYNGIVYAYIELASLEELVEPYLTEGSVSNFEECREFLKEWDVQADQIVHEVVDDFKEKTKFQLRCFRMVLTEVTDLEVSEDSSQPEDLPKQEELIIRPKPLPPPKEEPKPTKKQEPAEDELFKKTPRKYKPMPESFD